MTGHPYAHLAGQLQERLAKRETYKTPDVVAFVEEMRGELLRESTSESRALSTMRSITVQCLLVLGARSFSHFLNVVERYLPVLHAVSGTPDAKFEILGIVSGFWRRNGQFIGIIFDKLMQYQIVDPADVVSWAFEGNGLGPPPSEGLSTFQWEVMKSAVDKANGRVYKAQARVVQQTKADDDVRAAKHAADVEASATNGDGMEVDVANVNGACARMRAWCCLTDFLFLFSFIIIWFATTCRARRGECGTTKGKEGTWDASRGPESGTSACDGRVCDCAGRYG